jgi:hypothetical protein
MLLGGLIILATIPLWVQIALRATDGASRWLHGRSLDTRNRRRIKVALGGVYAVIGAMFIAIAIYRLV